MCDFYSISSLLLSSSLFELIPTLSELLQPVCISHLSSNRFFAILQYLFPEMLTFSSNLYFFNNSRKIKLYSELFDLSDAQFH